MSNAVEAELRLKFVDKGATSGLDRVARRVEQMTQQAENRVNQSNNRQRQSFERLSLARETLGMRSEQKIRREIQQTEAAYKRLATSGKISQDELSRAAEKTRQKITRLTNEMGKLTAEQQKAAKAAQAFETAQGRIRGVAAGGAGLLAAGYTLTGPVKNAINYDQQLAQTVNTAYPELDATGRGNKIGGVESIVNAAVRKYGGKREGALATYQNLLSSGAFSNQEAQDLLGLTLKGQTASGASSEDLANIMLAAKRSGVATADLPAALSKAIKAGQLGGFELSDLAKHLPALLSSARGLGVTGMRGFERVLVSAQGSVTTAGTKDEAANNLINIFEKINSEDTVKDFKKQGINLRKELKARINTGQDTITAFTGLIDEVIAKNPAAQAAAKKIDQLSAGTGRNDPNRLQNLEAIQKITESSVVGKFLQDRQALQGFRAERFGFSSGLFGRVGSGVSGDYGQELQTSFDVIANRPGFKVGQAEEEAAIRQKEAMDKLIPTITKAADMFIDLSQKYPDLSTAVIGATPPIIALGAASSMAAMTMGGGFGKIAALLGIGVGGVGAVAVGGSAGYGLGSLVFKPGIDKLTQLVTDDKNATLGTALYDYFNKPSDTTAKADVHLTVESTTPGFMVKQKSKSDGVSVTTKGSTGNIFQGAP